MPPELTSSVNGAKQAVSASPAVSLAARKFFVDYQDRLLFGTDFDPLEQTYANFFLGSKQPTNISFMPPVARNRDDG
jgi:hypothetical protein